MESFKNSTNKAGNLIGVIAIIVTILISFLSEHPTYVNIFNPDSKIVSAPPRESSGTNPVRPTIRTDNSEHKKNEPEVKIITVEEKPKSAAEIKRDEVVFNPVAFINETSAQTDISIFRIRYYKRKGFLDICKDGGFDESFVLKYR